MCPGCVRHALLGPNKTAVGGASELRRLGPGRGGHEGLSRFCSDCCRTRRGGGDSVAWCGSSGRMAEEAEAAEALHQRADEEAHHIIQEADKLSVDGKLSVLEMSTFLKGTEHEGFLEWILRDKYHAGGHWDYHAELRKANSNHDEYLQLDELTLAVEKWMSEGSPGLTVPRKVEVKRAELTEEEKRLIAFVVPGVPDVVLPPPPQKKRSIYEQPYKVKPTADSMASRTNFNSRAFDAKKPIGLRTAAGPSGLLLSSDDVAKSASGSESRVIQQMLPVFAN